MRHGFGFRNEGSCVPDLWRASRRPEDHHPARRVERRRRAEAPRVAVDDLVRARARLRDSAADRDRRIAGRGEVRAPARIHLRAQAHDAAAHAHEAVAVHRLRVRVARAPSM